MLSEELESPVSEATSSWYEVFTRHAQKRWVQIVLVLFAGTMLIALSGFLLAPKKTARETEPKFLFCPKCNTEGRYEDKLDGEPCPRCPEEPVGTLVGRAASIKETTLKSPWRWFHLVASLEAIVTVGTLVYLASRPIPDPSKTFYVFTCPHCGQRLRFRQVSLGGLGLCSRCKRPLRFPMANETILEADLIREEDARRAAEEQANQEDED